MDIKQIQVAGETYDINDAAARQGISELSNKVEVILPPTIAGIIGEELNIYFDNVIACNNLKNYQIDVVCTAGAQQTERWTYTPTTAGTWSLVINVYNNNTVLVATGSTSIVAPASTIGAGATAKCLFIGDSLTEAAVYTGEVVTLFGADNMDVILLGTRGTSPNLHEGRGGWTSGTYTGSATSDGLTNPFYNSGFDFAHYMTNQGYDSVDFVFITLGINDVFGYTTDATLDTAISNIIANYTAMVNSIHAFDANIKIGIAISVPPSASQDAFGKNYANTQTRWRYRRNILTFAKALISNFSGLTGQKTYLVPVNVNLDTANNMATETVAVNSRNAATVVRQSNAVHPAVTGYYQMADMFYYFIKSNAGELPAGTPITNIVTNGNFATGWDDWNALNCTIEAIDNVMYVTGANGSAIVQAYADTIPAVTAHKIYIKAGLMVTNAVCATMRSSIKGSTGGSYYSTPEWEQATPVQDQWYTASAVVTIDSTITGNLGIRFSHTYADAATAAGKIMGVKYVVAVDLTADFGAGNELLAGDMLAWLGGRTNEWFAGTANYIA